MTRRVDGGTDTRHKLTVEVGMSAAGFVVALLVGAVLISSGVAKVRGQTFEADLARYRLLPTVLVRPVARALPSLECALGTVLLVGMGHHFAVACAAVLFGAFTVAPAFVLIRGEQIPCGCGGSTRQVSWALVVSNAAIVAVLVGVLWSGSPGLWPALAGQASSVGPAQALGLVVVAALIGVLARLVVAAAHLHRSSRKARQVLTVLRGTT